MPGKDRGRIRPREVMDPMASNGSPPASSARRRFLAGAGALVVGAVAPIRAVAARRSLGREVRAHWTRHAIPPYPNGIPVGSKHTRWARRETTGDWYLNGGDYPHPGERPAVLDSGSNNTWRVDFRSGQWERVAGYWPREGEVVPSHPDETVWVYDSRRDIFWHGGGFQWKPWAPGKSPEDSPVPRELQERLLYSRWTSFDPTTRRFRDHGPTDSRVTGGNSRFGHYDREGDQVLVPRVAGSRNLIIPYDCAGERWLSSVVLPPPHLSLMGTDYQAFDTARRRIAFLRSADFALFVYGIADHSWRELSTSNRPEPRKANSYAFTYHASLDAFVLHGGFRLRTREPSNDLWLVPAEGGAWVEAVATGDVPLPRNSQVLLYDAAMNALISFGGRGGPRAENGYFVARLEEL